MIIIKTLPLEKPIQSAYVTLGVFDGVHVGHKKVIETLVSDAQSNSGKSVVITFDPHPREILEPYSAPPLLTSTAHKLNLFAQLGVDYCIIIPFTQEFAQLSPGKFINQYLLKNVEIAEICVGYDSSFGKNKTGTLNMLRTLGIEKGFSVKDIPPVKVDDLIVSSTMVRQLAIAGELESVEAMLDRKYSLWGTVVSGDTIGRKIGYPTANIDPHHEAIPPSGVYITEVKIDGLTYQGIMNIGYRPTFFQGPALKSTVEVHLLDFTRDIYGKDIEIIFLKKIREERRYPTQALLIEQIQRDEQKARKYFNGIYKFEKEAH
ncbi:MAG: bifunctional riboflavin kinase/FAD synthetase [Candidatus Auribacterota bacterium]|jgi:riboflavin kinase/FMN adenylyltransferase|uniref:Riboflavin biosynthesis protein n=1 Tax=Candidatus Auribacter fodinae TaxID=2093366 RepID=A0A3A4QYD5_9BACT|nr:MAG: bifunctional riboflavin kinase/FAD synthetase [Candidatus Auribacter fodinae]